MRYIFVTRHARFPKSLRCCPVGKNGLTFDHPRGQWYARRPQTTFKIGMTDVDFVIDTLTALDRVERNENVLLSEIIDRGNNNSELSVIVKETEECRLPLAFRNAEFNDRP